MPSYWDNKALCTPTLPDTFIFQLFDYFLHFYWKQMPFCCDMRYKTGKKKFSKRLELGSITSQKAHALPSTPLKLMLKPLPTRRLFAHSVNRHAVFFICLVSKQIDWTYSLCTLFVITAQRARLLRVQKAHMTQPCLTLSTSFWQLGCLCTAFLSCLRLTYGHFLNSSLTQMNDCNINIQDNYCSHLQLWSCPAS